MKLGGWRVGGKFVNKSEESGLADHHPLLIHCTNHNLFLEEEQGQFNQTKPIQTKPNPNQSPVSKSCRMRCPFYIILSTGCIQSPIYHRTFFNNTLNCFLLLILQLQQPVCCLLCCLVYSILSSWISMELCIFPYQHRGGPRPTLAQKGLTVYSVGHSLPTSRGLSFHISSSSSTSGSNHLWVGD